MWIILSERDGIGLIWVGDERISWIWGGSGVDVEQILLLIDKMEMMGVFDGESMMADRLRWLDSMADNGGFDA